MKHARLLVVVALVIVAAVGAAPRAGAAADARVRVVQASPHAPQVDVVVDNVAVGEALDFADVTVYTAVPDGTRIVTVFPSAGGDALVEGPVDVDAETDYTLVTAGAADDLDAFLLADDNRAPDSGQAHVRLVHMSSGLAAVDLVVSETLWADEVAYGQAGAYVAIDAGSYDLALRLHGEDTSLLEGQDVAFESGMVYTLFVLGVPDGEPNLLLLRSLDAEDAVAPPAGDDRAYVRLVGALPGDSVLDMALGDEPIFENLEFTDVSGYADVAPGTRTLRLLPHGDTEAVFEGDIELASGQDYTVAVGGTSDGVEAFLFDDNNAAPEPGEAHLRLIHLSSDAPGVTVAAANGTTLFEGVPYGEASPYVRVDAATFDAEVRAADTGAVLLSLSDITVEAGHVYTLFLVGLTDGEPGMRVIMATDAAPAGYALYLPSLRNKR